ncbi:M15 family metallopeptidase [Lyngbya confervoides]|uniref:D-alanyl-D-alanine carboxypeptidase family protein n=1 Tax=Lyngbya confervoides BDU141951 TaxID=1574623 RepID=A0ABD4T281_9CYAN|nr:M15 family metallopeptidase [Lyngbya confervoides]MCM1982847.1 D-alanyl-D-alanine carboxypeptidase family protein [Lyngbya confervoides BDU141951]
MHDDIPEARRQAVAPSPSQPPLKRSLGGLILGTTVLILGGVLLFSLWTGRKPAANPPREPSLPAARSDGTVLGHFPYDEAPPTTLVPLADNPEVQLRQAAAQAYEDMAAAARGDGIRLVPLSGFRSREDQEYLFFEVKKKRNQPTQERAEVSAPPGHSEHHTGYAIDIGDATAPETHVEVSFESTPGFLWLQENAARFSFELSFPKDNPQGVSYEPWHWRFVGDQESLETFFKGRENARPSPNP